MQLARKQARRPAHYNPFLSWISTWDERGEGIVKFPKEERVPVETWLEHLRSPFTFGQKNRLKSESVSARDLKTYEKFWRIANGRGILKQLFEDLSLNEREITRRMQVAGIGMSQTQVRLIREKWCPDRETTAVKRKRAVLALVEAHPQWSFKQIGEECGVSRYQAQDITKSAGVKKPNSRIIPPEERAAREKFLKDAEIFYDPRRGIVSVSLLKSRCLHMLQTHTYVVKSYEPILGLTSEKVDAIIRVLDSYGIDWRDYDKELWRLISNTPKAIHDKMKLFDDVGASPELHYLLLKRLFGMFKHYSSDVQKYVDLRKAVVESDMESILVYVRIITARDLRHMAYSSDPEYFEAARNAAVFVLSNCSQPTNNPAAFLSLMSAAVEVAISKKAYEFATKNSADEFGDGEMRGWVRKNDSS